MTRQRADNLLHMEMNKRGSWLDVSERAKYLQSVDQGLNGSDALLLAQAHGTTSEYVCLSCGKKDRSLNPEGYCDGCSRGDEYGVECV